MASISEQMGRMPINEPYFPVSPVRLWRYGTSAEKWLILGGWLLSLVASIGLGLATVIFGWSGIPLQFGGTEVYITIYAPHIICLWWTLQFGWTWGAIPAYLATFTLALYAGMPTAWALLFAFADPLNLAAISIGYRAIQISRDLRSLESILFYLQLAFAGAIIGSAGALVWFYTNQIDTTRQLPIWQGWWLGLFLESAFIVGPILYLTSPAMERWRSSRKTLMVLDAKNVRRWVLRLVLVVTFGVVGYGFLTIWLGTDQVSSALLTAPASPLAAAAEVLSSTAWVFWWIFAIIILFIGYFNYRVFVHWEEETAALTAELSRIAHTDALTNLLNRRAMEGVLEAQFSRFTRYNEPGVLLMLDIDHFKKINDSMGHAMGDQVLRTLADIIREEIRVGDTAARWGGEEFLFLLPHADVQDATAFAERLRVVTQERVVSLNEETVCFTVSIGVAYADCAMTTLYDWFRHADEALYDAKSEGRNRVVTYRT